MRRVCAPPRTTAMFSNGIQVRVSVVTNASLRLKAPRDEFLYTMREEVNGQGPCEGALQDVSRDTG